MLSTADAVGGASAGVPLASAAGSGSAVAVSSGSSSTRPVSKAVKPSGFQASAGACISALSPSGGSPAAKACYIAFARSGFLPFESNEARTEVVAAPAFDPDLVRQVGGGENGRVLHRASTRRRMTLSG